MVRAASRDLRAPAAVDESFVLAPAAARGHAASEPAAKPGRLVVVASPSLKRGQTFEPGPVAITFGRAESNTAPLPGDDYASGRHARIESARDGVWVHDLGSTNGTWVNGERMDGRQRLHDGDVVRIGQTELRYER